MAYDPQTPPDEKKQSVFGVIVHSFFVVPFLLAVFCVLLFTAVRILTMEKHSAQDYLHDIKAGGATKRWQAAFELSRLLSDPAQIPTDDAFVDETIAMYQQSNQDDPRVRQYLAMAMGKTGNPKFVPILLKDIELQKDENLYAIISAIGILKDKSATSALLKYLENENPRIRLATVIALGNIADPAAVEALKGMLNDTEANVTWDAAVALAKIGDSSGKGLLTNVHDRKYIEQFKDGDAQEHSIFMMVAIAATKQWQDPEIKERLKQLFESDRNMNVRNDAHKALSAYPAI